MSSPAVLDIDALVQPVPGDDPAGAPLDYAIRRELDEYRKEPVYYGEEVDPATANFKPEWGKVLKVGADTLTGKSKDLIVATRLLEAATKANGVPGLRDGLRLLRRLAAECWDHLHPKPEEGEGMEVRVGPFQWLNDRGKGAKFPQTIARAPIVRAGGQAFTLNDWHTPEQREKLQEAIAKVDGKRLRATYEDLAEALNELTGLSAELDAKVGAGEAPDLLSGENPDNVGNAIRKCLGTVEEVAKLAGVAITDEAPAADESPAGGEDGDTSSDAAPAGPAGVARDRDGLYRQLGQIATALRRMEPHSPVPYLIERCVKLGGLPFPALMRAVIREQATLDELDRLLDVERPPEGG